jgi:hypothetical protein
MTHELFIYLLIYLLHVVSLFVPEYLMRNRMVLHVSVWRFQPPTEDVSRCLESPEFECLKWGC